MPTEESLKQICELVESIQQAEIETKQESDILNIKIKGSEYEFPVKYEFCCKKVDSDLVRVIFFSKLHSYHSFSRKLHRLFSPILITNKNSLEI